MQKPTIIDSVQTPRQLRVTIALPQGLSFEGLTLRGNLATVHLSDKASSEQTSSHVLKLERRVQSRGAFCSLKQEGGQDYIVLRAPIDACPSDRRSA